MGRKKGFSGRTRLFWVGQLLPEPGHGPVEMVKLQSLTSFDLIILLPLAWIPTEGELPNTIPATHSLI